MTYGQNGETKNLVVPNDGCTASTTPWPCCTGPASGTCGGKYATYTSNDSLLTAPNRTPANRWECNWIIEQVERMQSWGFNSTADESIGNLLPTFRDNTWNTPDQTLPSAYRMPAGIEGMPVTEYSFRNNNGCSSSSAMKDMINGVAKRFPAYPYNAGDYYDSNWPTCLENLLRPRNSLLPTTGTSNYSWVVYLMIDEDGQVGWTGPGPDFYRVDGKGRLDTKAKGAYNAAWMILVTAPTQTSNSNKGISSYPDKEVYTKVKFLDLLATEYAAVDCVSAHIPFPSCTGKEAAANGSVDPSCTGSTGAYCMGGTYIGSNEMMVATKRLNTAWDSNYTTLSTSDPKCTNNLHSCLSSATYQSFGTGTGLLDENGAMHSWLGDSCTLESNFSPHACGSYAGVIYPAETNSMQADVSTLLTAYAAEYFSVLTRAWRTVMPGVMLIFDPGGFGNPAHKEVMRVAAQYLDLAQFTVPEYCSNCTDMQARIDFTEEYYGKKPWIAWVGFYANPDSSESVHRADNIASTQAERGTIYQSEVKLLTSSHTTAGSYPIVGFYWWDHADEDSEGLNWGWLSTYDNPYDGSASNVTWSTSATWISNHTYKAPATIYDGTNFEALTGSAFGDSVTCVSGSVAPNWRLRTSSVTSDDSCRWANEGPGTGAPDSAIPSTATISKMAYGDFVTAASAANNGIYDQIAPHQGVTGR